jgi:hypothetical protein
MGVVVIMATQTLLQLLPNKHVSFSYDKGFWVSSPTI